MFFYALIIGRRTAFDRIAFLIWSRSTAGLLLVVLSPTIKEGNNLFQTLLTAAKEAEELFNLVGLTL